MIFNIKNNAKSAAQIEFDGSMLYARNGADWEAAFLESGTIRFLNDPGEVEVFLCSNGYSGGTTARLQGNVGQWWLYGAGGGRGGDYLIRPVSLKRNVDYTLTIGAESTLSGGDVSLSTAAGTRGASGGQGAICRAETSVYASSGVTQQPGAGGDGIFAFNEPSDTTLIEEFKGKRFCAGGGGGDAAHISVNVFCSSDNKGGLTDAGNGSKFRKVNGVNTATDSTAGAPNSASGGGGARCTYEQNDDTSKAGGTGILFIRNRRN